VNADRNSKAAYIDMEFRTTPKLLLTAALRGEDYNDFGNTINGKVSFAFAATPMLNLRGSASSGFRAPSLHQRYFSSTFTDFIAGEAADVKLARNDSELAHLVGIPLSRRRVDELLLGLTWVPHVDVADTRRLNQHRRPHRAHGRLYDDDRTSATSSPRRTWPRHGSSRMRSTRRRAAWTNITNTRTLSQGSSPPPH
jgi:hypothetical protein